MRRIVYGILVLMMLAGSILTWACKPPKDEKVDLSGGKKPPAGAEQQGGQ